MTLFRRPADEHKDRVSRLRSLFLVMSSSDLLSNHFTLYATPLTSDLAMALYSSNWLSQNRSSGRKPAQRLAMCDRTLQTKHRLKVNVNSSITNNISDLLSYI